MKLIEYLQKLANEELSNLAVSDSPCGIRTNKIPMVVGYINEALLRLHTRFILKTHSVELVCSENRTRYHISSRHSWLKATPEDFFQGYMSDKYIQENPENAYTDDLIKIIEVYDSDGFVVPVNNHSEPMSVFTPQYDILEVPYPEDGLAFSVVYQAKHETLDYNRDPMQEINLPESLIGALGAYIGYLSYSNINTQEAIASAQMHLQKYEQILQGIVDNDIVSSSYSQSNSKFDVRGWL